MLAILVIHLVTLKNYSKIYSNPTKYLNCIKNKLGLNLFKVIELMLNESKLSNVNFLKLAIILQKTFKLKTDINYVRENTQ